MVAPRRMRLLPAALVGVIVATVFAALMQLPVQMLDVPQNMFEEVTLPGNQWWELLVNPIVLTGAIVIAVVASAETLLCATAVDQMHILRRHRLGQLPAAPADIDLVALALAEDIWVGAL